MKFSGGPKLPPTWDLTTRGEGVKKMDIRVYLRPLKWISRSEPVSESVEEQVSGPVADPGTLVPLVPGGDDDSVGGVRDQGPPGPWGEHVCGPVPDPSTLVPVVPGGDDDGMDGVRDQGPAEPVEEQVSGPIPDPGTPVPVVPGGDDDGVGGVCDQGSAGPDIQDPVHDNVPVRVDDEHRSA